VVTRLPRSVYVLQSGLVLNAFGNGAANPFVLLYLHDVRGIPLATAGLASAANAACALLASLAGGRVADQVGPKACVLGGLGSVSGSLIAAFVVGYLETFTAYLISPAYRTIPALLLLVIVMYIRPQGLLGRR